MRKQLRKNVSRMKRNSDTRISQHNNEVGDLVYCMDLTKTVGHCKKIDPGICQGPFDIVRKFSDLGQNQN